MDRDYLAYLGAKQRRKELAEEAAAVEKLIRDYETRSGSSQGTRRAAASQTRKRRKMTAAQKKAVSERMQKYWAARRKSKTAK